MNHAPARARPVRGALGAILMIVLMLTGCTTQETKMNNDYETLRGRGSSEQAGKRYVALMTDIQTILSKYNPTIVWPPEGPTKTRASLCGEEFDIDGAETVNYLSLGTGAVSDADWPNAIDEIRKLAATQGFTTPAMSIVRPGQHEYVIKDNQGASLEVGGAGNTNMGIFGSCHLTETAMNTTPSN